MKVTNLLLAALLTVSTAAFANAPAITAKALDSVLSKMTPKAVSTLGVQIGMKAGQSQTAVANGIAALLNQRPNDSQVQNLAAALQQNKASVSDLKMVVQAMASQSLPVEKKDDKTRSSQGVQLDERQDNRNNPDSVSGYSDDRQSNSAPRVCTTKEDPTSILEAGCSKVNSPLAIQRYEEIKAGLAAQNNGTLAGTLNNVVASSRKLVTVAMTTLKQDCATAIKTLEALKDSSCGLLKTFVAPSCDTVAVRN